MERRRGCPHMMQGWKGTGSTRFWGKSRYLGHPKANPASISQVGKGPCTYANFLIYEMPGHLDLLRSTPDGKYPQVRVSVRRGVPLKLHVGT